MVQDATSRSHQVKLKYLKCAWFASFTSVQVHVNSCWCYILLSSYFIVQFVAEITLEKRLVSILLGWVSVYTLYSYTTHCFQETIMICISERALFI